jgi:hypothetical protein
MGSDDSVSGEDFYLHTNQWLKDGAKEIINILPLKLKQKCVSATGVGTDFKVDLDGLGEILYVTRENADSGFLVPCRKIPSEHGGLAFEGSGHMMYEPSDTDPEYMLLAEEDAEVYSPQLATLKQDYQQGIAILKGGEASPQQRGGR